MTTGILGLGLATLVGIIIYLAERNLELKQERARLRSALRRRIVPVCNSCHQTMHVGEPHGPGVCITAAPSVTMRAIA